MLLMINYGQRREAQPEAALPGSVEYSSGRVTMGSIVSFLRRNLFSIIVAVATSLIISAELYVESSVFWIRAGISFAVLLPLFVLLSEKHLFQKQKQLLNEKKGWPLLLEILTLPGITCAVFVALLLFAEQLNLLPGMNLARHRRKDVQTFLGPADITAQGMILIEVQDHHGVKEHHEDDAAAAGEMQVPDDQGGGY